MHTNKNAPPQTLATPQIVLIAGIAAAGGAVRLLLAHALPFWGDEPGTMKWICSTPRYILTHYETWLTMNWFILLEKGIAHSFGESFIAMRGCSVLAGTVTVILAYALTVRLFQSRTAGGIAAGLFAANPVLIQYGAEARVYSTFLCLSLIFWLFILRWREHPGWANSVRTAAAALLLMLAFLNGLFLIAWLVIVLCIEGFKKRRAVRDFAGAVQRLVLSLALCMWPAGLFYFQLRNKITVANRGMQPSDLGFFEHVLAVARYYFGYQNTGIILLFMLLIGLGLIKILRGDRYNFLLIISYLSIPLAAVVLMDYTYTPVHSVRYFIFVLPLLLIVMAGGLVRAAALFSAGRRLLLVASLAAALIISGWIPAITQRLAEKDRLPFNSAYNYIAQNRQPGDRIVGLEPFTLLLLSPYMPCAERQAASNLGLASDTMGALLKHAESGRVFTVATTAEIPALDAQSASFGAITVSILPPEPYDRRYDRLIGAYTRAEQKLSAALVPEHALIYKPLADLARLRGDQKTAGYYDTLVNECVNLLTRQLGKT